MRANTMVQDAIRSASETVTVRAFRDLSEMQGCVELQQLVWGYSALDIVPPRIFLVAARCNAQVLGAFDGDRVIGYSLAFLATRDQQLFLHSHMVGVHPDYQNKGVGRLLKLAQRSDALARGIDLIEWTFDPLQARNAYFNLVRLGAIVRTYIPDFYGSTSSPLHGGLPTDRLVAEWHLRSPGAVAAIQNQKPERSAPREIRIAANVTEIAKTEPAQARAIQLELQSRLEDGFKNGYAVTGLEIRQNQIVYLMEPYEG